MSFARWAVRYTEIGLAVFPLAERSKIPLKGTQGFKDATTDREAVARLWRAHPQANIGVAVPSDLVVVDIDNDEALHALRALDAELPATVHAKTGKGYHFWYRCDPGEFSPKVGIFEGVDLRAAGSYVVAPPSIHPTGRRYEWVVPPKKHSFAVRPDWLAESCTKASEGAGTKVEATEVLAGVSEGGRDVTLFRYACSLRARGVSREEAEALILHAAARCSPPFAEKEAREKVASAWKYKSDREERQQGETKHWTAPEFLQANFPAPRWFVDRLLPEGLTLVVSPAKVGKSFLVGNIAYSIAVGGVVLGYLPTKKAGVLYLDLEQSEAPAQDRWKKIIGGSAPANLHFFFEWERIGAGCIAKLEEFLEKEPAVGVVVVDVLSLIWPMEGKRGGNAYHQEYEILSRLKSVAKRWGIALVLVHHTNRGLHSDPMHSVSGTNAMTGVPDAVWLLSRARGKTVGELYVTGRSVPELKEDLAWEPYSCTWRLQRDIRIDFDKQIEQDYRRLM